MKQRTKKKKKKFNKNFFLFCYKKKIDSLIDLFNLFLVFKKRNKNKLHWELKIKIKKKKKKRKPFSIMKIWKMFK